MCDLEQLEPGPARTLLSYSPDTSRPLHTAHTARRPRTSYLFCNHQAWLFDNREWRALEGLHRIRLQSHDSDGEHRRCAAGGC